MAKKRRTEIRIETDRTLVIRHRTEPSRVRCPRCGELYGMMSPDEVNEQGPHPFCLGSDAATHIVQMPPDLVLLCVDRHSALSPGLLPANTTASHLPLVSLQELQRSSTREPRTQNLRDGRAETPHVGSHPELPMSEAAHNSSRRKKPWVLTSEAFNQLLACLGSDRDCAAEEYEKIRRKLIKYFECRGCLSPEEQADETINRVARRISEGSEIWTIPANYFYGVARNVLREYWNSPEREVSAVECIPPLAHASEEHISLSGAQSELTLEMALRALEHCLNALSPANRELILEYYQGEKGDKIRNRRRMAKQLGIATNALRIKVHRIRARLESEVHTYVKQERVK